MIEFRLAEVMGKHKLKMKDVAEQTGIRPNTISAYWHGTAKRIDVEHLRLLCALFQCQPGDIITYTNSKGEGQ